MIASPLSVKLMEHFQGPESVGIAETFICMGAIYFVFMMFGMLTVRIPSGSASAVDADQSARPQLPVAADQAIRTPQFWLVFTVLMLNVTAGIGVLGQASIMIQEMFSAERAEVLRPIDAAAAAGFVGLLSLFNMVGRFFWSSTSDRIGRKNTYSVFFVLGAILYFLIPSLGSLNSPVGFILGFCVIISMYGGGFATVPAYLKDLFGTYQVGAIHGRLLLAWSLAAIFGPTLVNYIRAYQIESLHIPASKAYSTTMYIMAGLLILGLIANLAIKPVNPKYHVQKNQ